MRNTEKGTVLHTITDSIVTLTIDHPPANALDNATIDLLRESFTQLDPLKNKVRGVILTGTGSRFFCAGGDLKELDGMTGDHAVERIRAFHGVLCAIEYLEVPIACAINGDAVGGGTEFCLFADYRLAVTHARFGLPEVNHGLLPAAKSIQQAVRLLGIRGARRLLYGGELISAEEAAHIGLIDHVFENEEELRRETRAWAVEMAAKPRELVGPIKRTIRLTGHLSDELLEEMTISDFHRYFESGEVREQLRAVLSRWKRPRRR